MLSFELLEDQDWYKRRVRKEEPRKAVYVELCEGSSIEDVPIRMIATFTDGSEHVMFGRILRQSEEGLPVVQAVNGKGDTLLCVQRKT